MQRRMEDVRRGTLDFTLTTPEDAQALLSVRQIEIWKMVDVTVGFVVIIIALVRLREAIGPREALAFLVAMLAGGAIVYSFLLVCARREHPCHLPEDVRGRALARRHLPPWLQFALTSLVPIAFAVTVPAAALTDRLTAQTLLIALALALGMLALSRWFWRVGLRQYSGASA